MGNELNTYIQRSKSTVTEDLLGYAKTYRDDKNFWLFFKDKIQTELSDEWYYGYSDNGIMDAFNVSMFGYIFKISFVFKSSGSLIRHYKKTGIKYNPEWKGFADIPFNSNTRGTEKDAYAMKLILNHLEFLKEEFEKE